jgi:hypothetical protein
MRPARPIPSLVAAGLALVVAALLALQGCATSAAVPAGADGAASAAAPAKPACEPEPFCYQACLRGYQPAYCRFHCGC